MNELDDPEDYERIRRWYSSESLAKPGLNPIQIDTFASRGGWILAYLVVVICGLAWLGFS